MYCAVSLAIANGSFSFCTGWMTWLNNGCPFLTPITTGASSNNLCGL